MLVLIPHHQLLTLEEARQPGIHHFAWLVMPFFFKGINFTGQVLASTRWWEDMRTDPIFGPMVPVWFGMQHAVLLEECGYAIDYVM